MHSLGIDGVSRFIVGPGAFATRRSGSERLQLDRAASAGRKSGDRPPTTPTNLRITASGARSVSLAWNPSTDDSGDFTYRIVRSGGLEMRVPSTQTSFTWATVLHSGQTYSFYVYAQDAAGKKSSASNTVTVTLPPDTQAPTAPVLSATTLVRHTSRSPGLRPMTTGRTLSTRSP